MTTTKARALSGKLRSTYYKHPARRRISRRHPEQSLQVSLVRDLLKILPQPECYLTAFPAGGGGKIRGAILKRMGLRAGFPDLLLIYRGIAYGLELKSEGGKLQPEQKEEHDLLARAGMDVKVIRSLDDALETLREWKIPTRVRF